MDGIRLRLLLTACYWITLRAALSVSGTVSSSSSLNGPYGIACSGDYVYAALYNGNGLAVIDVSNKASPSVTATLTDSTNLQYARYVALDAQAEYAYVTANYRFTVVDVRDKSNPVIGEDASYNHNWLNEAMMVQVSPLNPNIVFAVAWRGHSLTAMDVTNKSAPVRAGVYRDTTNAVTNWAWGLAVKDDRASRKT